MIRIPLNKRVNKSAPAPLMAASDGQQQMRSALYASKTLGNAADKLSGTAEKLRDMENKTMVQSKLTDLREEVGLFKNGLANRHDPEAWQGEYDEIIARHENAAADLPESEREAFLGRLDSFALDNKLSIDREGKRQVLRESGMSYENDFERLGQIGDKEGQRELIANNHLFSPEQREAELLKFDNEQRNKELYDMATADPVGTLQMLGEDDNGKLMWNIDDDTRDMLTKHANKQVQVGRKNQMEEVDYLLESGAIRTPEQWRQQQSQFPYLTEMDGKKIELAIKKGTKKSSVPITPELEKQLMREGRDVMRLKHRGVEDAKYLEKYNDWYSKYKNAVPSGYKGNLSSMDEALNPALVKKDHEAFLRDSLGKKSSVWGVEGMTGITDKKSNRYKIAQEVISQAEDEALEWARSQPNFDQISPQQVLEKQQEIVTRRTQLRNLQQASGALLPPKVEAPPRGSNIELDQLNDL